LAKEIAKFARCAAFDLQGHGAHKNRQTDFSLTHLIAESEASLAYLQEQFPSSNVVVVGHSLGGAIAARLVDKIFRSGAGDRLIGYHLSHS